MRLSRRSSHDSSNAVSKGSRELSAINELADRARYALMRLCECLNESVSLDVIHSSQPHLENYILNYDKKYRISIGRPYIAQSIKWN